MENHQSGRPDQHPIQQRQLPLSLQKLLELGRLRRLRLRPSQQQQRALLEVDTREAKQWKMGLPLR